MADFSIEKIDALARDVCRCFAEGDRIGAVTYLYQAQNHIETALIVSIACGFMSKATRLAFIDFLTLQAMSLVATRSALSVVEPQ